MIDNSLANVNLLNIYYSVNNELPVVWNNPLVVESVVLLCLG